MKLTVLQYSLLLADGRMMTRDQRNADFFANGQKPIRVIGLQWQINDVIQNTVTKNYAPYSLYSEDLLPDRTGLIVTEPHEIAGAHCVVVYNADGNERFRLKPTIDPTRYPAYMHNAELVSFEGSRVHKGFAARFETSLMGGARILEFDQETGEYTGQFVSIRD